MGEGGEMGMEILVAGEGHVSSSFVDYRKLLGLERMQS